jgi:hypothetical protein
VARSQEASTRAQTPGAWMRGVKTPAVWFRVAWTPEVWVRRIQREWQKLKPTAMLTATVTAIPTGRVKLMAEEWVSDLRRE